MKKSVCYSVLRFGFANKIYALYVQQQMSKRRILVYRVGSELILWYICCLLSSTHTGHSFNYVQCMYTTVLYCEVRCFCVCFIRILTLNGEEVEETEIDGFVDEEQTYYSGNVDNKKIVQVCGTLFLPLLLSLKQVIFETNHKQCFHFIDSLLALTSTGSNCQKFLRWSSAGKLVKN